MLIASSKQYFYKMSRTYLKDARTSERVDPIYSYSGDLSLPPPRPKLDLGPRMSVGATPRHSQTPLHRSRQPRDSLANFGDNGFGTTSGSSSFMYAESSQVNSRLDQMPRFGPCMSLGATPRLSQTPLSTGQQLRGSLANFHDNSFSTTNDSSFLYAESSQGNMLDRVPSSEHQNASQQFPFAELSSLKAIVESHGALIQQLQNEISQLRAPSYDRPYARMHSLDIVPTPEASSGSIPNDELNTIREENRILKTRLATVATAMGLVAEDTPDRHSVDNVTSNASRRPSSSLGKRKRGVEQLPAPHSTQEMSDERGVSFRAAPLSCTQSFADRPFEGDIIMDDNAPHDKLNDNNVSSVRPATPSTHLNGPTACGVGAVNDIVEFSDDEMAGVHFPTIQNVLPKLTIQQYKDLQGDSNSNNGGSVGPVDLDQVQIVTPEDIRKQIEEEKMPKPPKPPRVPVEPKERIQSTAKYLDAELEELGLAEWIGKDKKSAEYRTAIQNARAARREAKKMEALARRGLKSTPIPQPKSKHPRTSAAPFKDAVPEDSTDAPSIKTRGATNTTEPLTEVTAQEQNKASGSKASNRRGRVAKKAAPPKGRRATGIEAAQENESEAGVVTRRQQREAQILERDRMVQAALEMEES